MSATPGVLYLDLDGTLLGPGGRVVPDTLVALDEARAAGWTPALLTGRSRWTAGTIGRLLGVDDVVCELGAVILRQGAEVRVGAAGDDAPPRPPADAVVAAIAAAGPVGEHEPAAPRVAGFVLRAAVAQDAATRALDAAGLGAWHAVDNGPSHRGIDGAAGAEPRVLHVLPRGVDKRAGVRAHLALAGARAADAAAVGDSPADLAVAEAVGRVVLVAGDPRAGAAARAAGVPVTSASTAAGVREAVALLGRCVDR